MKKILLLSIIMFPALVWAQVTNHFGHLDSKWNVAETYIAADEHHPGFCATKTTVYGVHGDTTINSKLWLKIYSTKDSSFKNKLLFRGLARTENNKVFYIDTLNQLSTLYDFNLTVGDSVRFNFYGTPEWIKVIKVDSIQLNGEFYKRLKFAERTSNAFDLFDEVWIEGIGSTHGPLFPNLPRTFMTEAPDSVLLTCSFSNNKQIWKSPSYKSCYVNIVLGVHKIEALDFKIYPNPCDDRIYFENSRIGSYHLTISNAIGQEVRKLKTGSNKETIMMTDLKAGFYLLTISNGERTKTVKIIKNTDF